MDKDKRIQLKPHISIKNIGKLRFWTGIGLGILNAIIFFVFIFFLLEFAEYYKVCLGYDTYIDTSETIWYEKTLLIAFTSILGSNVMLRYWFQKPTYHFQKTFRHTTLRITHYSLFIQYLALYVGIGFVHKVIIPNIYVKLEIVETYGWIIFLVPICMFFSMWTEVSRYLKTQRWMLYVFAILLTTTTLLSFVNIPMYSYAKIAYEKMYEEDFEYLTNEIAHAQKTYQVTFDAETITTVKQTRSKELENLLVELKDAFKSDKKVTMKQILLEKIMIHNFKGYYLEFYDNYYYTQPYHVYRQLKKVAPNSAEANELINILKEFEDLVTYGSMEYDPNVHTHSEAIRIFRVSNMLLDNFHGASHYRMLHKSLNDMKHGLLRSNVYNHHPFVKYLKSDAAPPLLPLSPDIYDYSKEFPEFGEGYTQEK
ncbi:hypothetical protein [Kordia jejudonensis]|uniref:hypothetical protein n=1 Tax=Kordia jejudonensis TaxID=1348245 RepID=UPI000629A988|nr:hypothetical protein [Kordia jejudonensis]